MTNPIKAIEQSILEKERTIALLEKNIADLKMDLKRDREALAIYSPQKAKQAQKVSKREKPTFWQKLEGALDEKGYPLNTGALLLAANQKFPKYPTVAKSWSPQLSMAIKARPDLFKVYKANDRFFYGLKKWFKGDIMKDDVAKKFEKVYNINATSLFG